MRDIIKRNPAAVLMAVAMHVAIIAFMLAGMDWLEKPVQPKSNVDIVQAKMIDQSMIDAEVEKLKKADDAKKAKEKKRLADIKRKQDQEKKKLVELEKKRKAKEKKAKADAKKHLAAEKKQKADAKKRAADEKRKATEKKKKLAAEKKRKEAEARQKAEAEKKRKEVEARKKAEAEKKRKEAEAEKKRKAAEAAARQAAEQKTLEDALQAGLEAEQMATEREQFVDAIKRKIENNWLRPTTVSGGLSCQLRVRLMPGGGVASVAVTRSSGNGAFDRSVEKAVYKADPFSVPEGAGFEAFRDLKLNFNPTK